MYFGIEALQQKIDGEEVFEVHLDIEKFYDRIDRPVLVSEVLKFCEVPDDVVLNRLLTQFVNWEWDDESPAIYKRVCADSANRDIPRGIPQGLLAGGFLANIYLMNFDEELVKLIDTKVAIDTQTEFEITLHDYCRYVDDIRLVITTNKPTPTRKLKASIEKKLSDLLPAGLKFNPDKSKVEKFRTRRSGISSKLGEIQSKVSGPLSINEIDEQLGHLEGLIALADTLRGNENIDSNNPLAGIESPNNDVREDTLLRFSANKIHSLLTKKRSLIAHEVDESGDRIAGSWDYLQERMSRKFIACWAKDPSLVLMLKKGIELFPDKRILAPVMEQLIAVTKREDAPKQQKVAEYCIGEIFRHAATTIHIKELEELPAHADVNGFFECLQNYAISLIESTSNDE